MTSFGVGSDQSEYKQKKQQHNVEEENVGKNNFKGSGCGSVGRAVASDTRGPWFESSHRQNFISNIYCQLY